MGSVSNACFVHLPRLFVSPFPLRPSTLCRGKLFDPDGKETRPNTVGSEAHGSHDMRRTRLNYPCFFLPWIGLTVVRRVYMHEEGLCRLATEPYRNDAQSFGNRFIHLTNYSINRKSSRYEPGTTRYADPRAVSASKGMRGQWSNG